MKSEFQIDTKLIGGGVGEFTVWVDGELVAKKGSDGFPSEAEIVAAVKALPK